MSNAYSIWLDREVVLQVVAGDLRVPLQGRVVNELSNAVRVRIGGVLGRGHFQRNDCRGDRRQLCELPNRTPREFHASRKEC